MFVKDGRRVPAQERSRKRRAQMLDAAAKEFAERGFDAATMESIAERAGTSIGSIYQFFPNKLGLFDELAKGYRENLRVFFGAMVTGPLMERTWQEILEASIDALAAFHESQPGFRAVWVGLRLTPEFVAEGEAMNRELAQQVEAIFSAKLEIPKKKRRAVATMVVEVVTTTLIVIARRPDEGKSHLEETKELLLRYLAAYDGAALRSPRRKS